MCTCLCVFRDMRLCVCDAVWCLVCVFAFVWAWGLCGLCVLIVFVWCVCEFWSALFCGLLGVVVCLCVAFCLHVFWVFCI